MGNDEIQEFCDDAYECYCRVHAKSTMYIQLVYKTGRASLDLDTLNTAAGVTILVNLLQEMQRDECLTKYEAAVLSSMVYKVFQRDHVLRTKV